MKIMLLICFSLMGLSAAVGQQYDVDAYNMLINNPAQFRIYLQDNPDVEVNLKGAVLNGADLSQMQLDHVNLSYAKLEGANFKESDLSYANFTGANIKQANFSRTTLEYTDFSKANATGATFLDAKFKHTELIYLLVQIDNALYPASINAQGMVIPASK